MAISKPQQKFFSGITLIKLSSTWLSLTSFETNLLDCIVAAVLSVCIKKKNLPKLVNFRVAILILKTEEATFSAYYALFQDR